MLTNNTARRVVLLASVCGAAIMAQPARAASVTVTSGQTYSTADNISGTDTVTVQSGGTFATTTGPAVIWNAPATGGGVTISNAGLLGSQDAGNSAGIFGGPAATGTLTITNTGTMGAASRSGPALDFSRMTAAGNVVLNNYGIIAGGGYQAIGFGAGNDTLNLYDGSAIDKQNRADGGGGANVLNLYGAGGIVRGASEGTSDVNSFQGYDNFQTLNVNAGTWSLVGGGYYNTLTVAGGATLNVCASGVSAACGSAWTGVAPKDGGLGPLGTVLTAVNNGTINNFSSDAKIYYDPTHDAKIQLTGTGSFVFKGPAQAYFGPTSTATQNLFEIAGGSLIDAGSLTGTVQVDSGATFQIGSGGTLTNINNVAPDNGKTGSLTGNLVNNGTAVFNRVDDYTFAGNISGTGALIKRGAGKVTLTGVNSATGNVSVEAGNLTVSAPLSLTGTRAISVSSGATLTSSTPTITWNGAATGAGVSVTNAGTLAPGVIATAAATGTFTLVNSGTLGTAAVSPILFGAVTSAGTANVTNTGTILSNGTAVTLGAGNDTFTNGGNLTGNVALGAGNDILNLTTGSKIAATSKIDGGSGTNVINLGGTGGLVRGVSDGAFAGFDNFQTLNVNAGAWTLVGGGYYDNLTIASGASLTACDIPTVPNCASAYSGQYGTTNDGGVGPLGTTLNLAVNGTFISNSKDTGIYYDPTGGSQVVRVTGTGIFQFTSNGGVAYVGPQDDLTTFRGTVVMDGGTFIVAAPIAANVQINPGSTVQVGSGGNLKNVNNVVVDNGKVGDITGNVVDNGTLVFNRLDDFNFSANLSGNGNIVKKNANTVTLTGVYTYTGTTTLEGGAVTLASAAKLSPGSTLDTGSGTVNLGGTQQTVGGVAGGGTINTGGGSLTSNQNGNSIFTGRIIGPGTFIKLGTGSLILDGNNNSFTGSTTVSGGLLEVGDATHTGAVLGGPVSVTSGGTLGGHGTVLGSVTNAGATAPGGSIGTLNVNGSYSFASGSVLQTEAAANGATDLLNVTGAVTIANGATVQAQPTDPATSYARLTTYTIVTGAGGVSGAFSGATSTNAALTPVLGYTNNAVTLTLVRNDMNLSGFAAGSNQAAVATALSSAPSTAIFGAVAVNSSTVMQQAFDALSGEVHATVSSVLLNGSQFFADLVRTRDAAAEGIRLWATENYRQTRLGGGAGTAQASAHRQGFGGGVDLPVLPHVRAGAAMAYSDDTLGVAARSSRAAVNSLHGGIYVDYADGPVSATIGGAYGDHDIGTARTIQFTGFNQSESATYHAHSLSAFGELRYRLSLGSFDAEPFARLNVFRLEDGAFQESAGTAALNGAASSQQILFTQVGVRISKSYALGDGVLRPLAGIAWEHSGDNQIGARMLTFASGGASFGVTGAAVSQNAAATELGLDFQSGAFGVRVFYAGRFGGASHENAINLHLNAAL